MLDFYRSDKSKMYLFLLCILLLVQILLCANSAYSVFSGSNILLDTARPSVQHIFFVFFFFLRKTLHVFSLLQQAPITSNLCSFPSLLTNISILGSQITGTEIKFFCYLWFWKLLWIWCILWSILQAQQLPRWMTLTSVQLRQTAFPMNWNKLPTCWIK